MSAADEHALLDLPQPAREPDRLDPAVLEHVVGQEVLAPVNQQARPEVNLSQRRAVGEGVVADAAQRGRGSEGLESGLGERERPDRLQSLSRERNSFHGLAGAEGVVLETRHSAWNRDLREPALLEAPRANHLQGVAEQHLSELVALREGVRLQLRDVPRRAEVRPSEASTVEEGAVLHLTDARWEGQLQEP